MNIPNEYYLGYIKLPFQRRHWIAIKNINGNYYNLDSKLKEPVLIGGVSIYVYSLLLNDKFIKLIILNVLFCSYVSYHT